jgi:hypothetical protein
VEVPFPIARDTQGRPGTLNRVRLHDLLRPRRQAVAQIEPDPLRTPEDATETGLIVGATAPWIGIAFKDFKDRRVATGGAKQELQAPARRAGRSSGKRAAGPPHA